MTKQDLQDRVSNINASIYSLENKRRIEIETLQNEKTLHLVKQIEKIKSEIWADVYAKYEEEESSLIKQEEELEQKLAELNIANSQKLWYPHGTKVTLWKQSSGYYTFSNFIKGEQKGTVQIYDGTQQISNTIKYSKPNKGDIMVFYDKKDGTMGLNYDVISRFGKILDYHPMWLSDTDTPENNIKTRSKETGVTTNENNP